ncbi:hypothetical protein [Streptomyces sp. NPDC057199]|uniref:hypothetical protein n=1 Tax=Streptomyces sp. NPDC057199 TaxID=3346047 RepID=UPI00363656C3
MPLNLSDASARITLAGRGSLELQHCLAVLFRRPINDQTRDSSGVIERLAKAAFRLSAVEDDVLCTLTEEQREALYELLQQAVNGNLPCSKDPGVPVVPDALGNR